MALTVPQATALVHAVDLLTTPHPGTVTSQTQAAIKAAEALVDAELTAAEGGAIDDHQRGPFRALAAAPDHAYHREAPAPLASLKARAAALNP